MQLKNLIHWPGVSWQAAHYSIGGVLFIGLWVMLARYWGGALFGEFNYVYAYAAFWGIVFDFGLDVIVTRLVAGGRVACPRSLVTIKAVVVLAGGIVAVGLAAVAAREQLGVVLILLPGVAFLSCANLVNGYLRGIERLDVEAKIGLAQKCLFVAVSLAGVVSGQGMVWVALCYAGSQALVLAVTTCIGVRLGFSLATDQVKGPFKRLPEALLLWGVALTAFLALRLDLFMLRHLAGDVAVGTYSAGFRIIEGFSFLGLAFMGAFFPRLARAHATGAGLSDLLKRGWALLFAVGAGIAVALALTAPFVVQVLYGEGYGDALQVLRYLGAALPLVYVNLLLGHAFMAMARPVVYLWALLGAVAVGLAAGLLLIPAWGVLGAVAGLGVRELATLVFLSVAFARKSRGEAA